MWMTWRDSTEALMGWCLHSIEILVEKGGQEEGRSGVREEGGVAIGDGELGGCI